MIVLICFYCRSSTNFIQHFATKKNTTSKGHKSNQCRHSWILSGFVCVCICAKVIFLSPCIKIQFDLKDYISNPLPFKMFCCWKGQFLHLYKCIYFKHFVWRNPKKLYRREKVYFKSLFGDCVANGKKEIEQCSLLNILSNHMLYKCLLHQLNERMISTS